MAKAGRRRGRHAQAYRRLELDPGADVHRLERIMSMYEVLRAKEAELAYNAAKGRILKKLAGIKIVKNRSTQTKLAMPSRNWYLRGHSNTRLWRRSTNICGRYWRKRICISPIPTNPRRAAFGSAAV
jgi:hypothetical protein